MTETIAKAATISKNRILVMCAIAIAINYVLGVFCAFLKLPFYLDTLGTVFIAICFGPWWGAAVGGLTNLMTGLLASPKDIPFLLVSVAIAIVVGFIARKFKFTLLTAVITGIIIGVVAPVIGTPIGVWVYGGLTGSVSDVLVLWLRESGMGIFGASFLPKLLNNQMDKIGTCLVAFLLLKAMPKSVLPGGMNGAN
ncbi:MAG: ECF transporter S component [Oscillospiraceae bacterium]